MPSFSSPYTNPAEEVKRVGHIMGLKGGLRINGGALLMTEGAIAYDASLYVQEKLSQYQPTSHVAEWLKIKDMFDITTVEVKVRSSSIEETPEKAQVILAQISRYDAGEPVHICSGSESRAVGVTLYKGYIVVSDRGEATNQGTTIYKLNKEELTVDNLLELQKSLSQRGVLPRDHQATLERMQGDKIGSFPQQQQKYGTCEYVNKIASTEGILCLLSLDEKGQLNDGAVRAYSLDDNNRAAYKHFTQANRISEVQRITDLINQAIDEQDNEKLETMVNIAFCVLEKYGRETKNTQKQAEEHRDSQTLIAAIKGHTHLLSHENQKRYASLVDGEVIVSFEEAHSQIMSRIESLDSKYGDTGLSSSAILKLDGARHSEVIIRVLSDALESLDPKSKQFERLNLIKNDAQQWLSYPGDSVIADETKKQPVEKITSHNAHSNLKVTKSSARDKLKSIIEKDTKIVSTPNKKI